MIGYESLAFNGKSHRTHSQVVTFDPILFELFGSLCANVKYDGRFSGILSFSEGLPRSSIQIAVIRTSLNDGGGRERRVAFPGGEDLGGVRGGARSRDLDILHEFSLSDFVQEILSRDEIIITGIHLVGSGGTGGVGNDK